mgnify:CR=1 FL=1
MYAMVLVLLVQAHALYQGHDVQEYDRDSIMTEIRCYLHYKKTFSQKDVLWNKFV